MYIPSSLHRRALLFGSGLVLSLAMSLGCTDDGGGNDEVAEGESGDSGDATGDGDGDSGETGGDATRPNWYEDVSLLVAENCTGCHNDGGIAPFSMESYESTAPWAGLIADSTEDKLMPPWHASVSDQCQPPFPYLHDPQLSDEQIQMFRDWADLGAPEGDPADAVELPAPPDLGLADPSTTVLMESPIEVAVEGSTLDYFHCVSFDPGNTEEVYVDGFQVIEGNREILHHVLMYVDTDGESASWEGGVKENCGGGSGLSGAPQLVAGWVPGSAPLEPPEGVAVTLPPGARIVYNVHYHATGAGPQVDDSTGVALRWSNQAPDYTSLFTLIGSPGIGTSNTGLLHIPAGEKNHFEEFEWEVSVDGQPIPDIVDIRIWTIANHMHKVGVNMKVWIERAGEELCLLHTPRWDFNWQRFYNYDVPIEDGFQVKGGDVVHVQCEYDNTLDNPAVVEALAEVGLEEPIDVFVGEGTLDEMCLAAIGVGYKLF
jgi:hypothetical protein